MDLLEESKKGNKIAFIELTSKYNHIFYKISRLFFTNDKDIEEILEKVFSKTFIEIVNIRSEQEFLTKSIYVLISKCNEKEDSEIIKIRKKSFVEEKLSKIIEYLRLPALLYYYADLSTVEISKILKISELEASNFIAESRLKLSKELKKEELMENLPNSSANTIDNAIKKIFKSDVYFNKSIFNNLNNHIQNTIFIQNKYSNNHMNILVLIILLLFGVVIYVIGQNLIEYSKKSYTVNFQNTLEIDKTEKISKPILKPNFENKTKENIINSNNLITSSTTNSTAKTENIIITNTSSAKNTIKSTPIKINNSTTNDSATPHSNSTTFNEFELEIFMENYAAGIERISYGEETLESNTILLYIAEQYLASKSKKSSLEIDTTYATTAQNIHKYLTDITTTDYTIIEKISAYNNYIRYSESSKSYLYGTDHSILLKESYDCSNISILSEQDGIYTATANVIRTLDDQKTNYEITFTFKLNSNYTYEKFKILSLKANNTSFTQDNTVHFVDIPTEEDEK